MVLPCLRLFQPFNRYSRAIEFSISWCRANEHTPWITHSSIYAWKMSLSHYICAEREIIAWLQHPNSFIYFVWITISWHHSLSLDKNILNSIKILHWNVRKFGGIFRIQAFSNDKITEIKSGWMLTVTRNKPYRCSYNVAKEQLSASGRLLQQ